jgi:hypothetical protein
MITEEIAESARLRAIAVEAARTFTALLSRHLTLILLLLDATAHYAPVNHVNVLQGIHEQMVAMNIQLHEQMVAMNIQHHQTNQRLDQHTIRLDQQALRLDQIAAATDNNRRISRNAFLAMTGGNYTPLRKIVSTSIW